MIVPSCQVLLLVGVSKNNPGVLSSLHPLRVVVISSDKKSILHPGRVSSKTTTLLGFGDPSVAGACRHEHHTVAVDSHTINHRMLEEVRWCSEGFDWCYLWKEWVGAGGRDARCSAHAMMVSYGECCCLLRRLRFEVGVGRSLP